MIKEILEQLAPLDAQITALKGSGDDMDAITAHAAELAELALHDTCMSTNQITPTRDEVVAVYTAAFRG